MAMANKDLKNHAYSVIKDRLINCIYEPGSFLNESMLANELGLSRTPIREAISRLETDGLLVVMPKKGIYVSEISINDVHQIFQTRLEIEPITVRMASSYLPEDVLLTFKQKFSEKETGDIKNSFKLDTAMHLFIIEYCGNRYIIEMMKKLFEDNTRVIIASKQNQCNIHDARLEHLEIIDSLLSHDTEKSVELMRTHIESCRRAAIDYFYSLQAYTTTPSDTYKKVLQELE
ncbi:GntR family transcriptional regulator [Enterocloster asparagiformis]|uniref:GntR family transcriptional regulator n=1 Tax=Enterocloster asparagiformis TaxID=333367 RepID=UPI002A83B40D|nr:GntR family transcriptional regulator [Enterocloster asparagiformis]